jgi:hypothetical protein
MVATRGVVCLQMFRYRYTSKYATFRSVRYSRNQYLGEAREVDGQQTVGRFLPLVRREDHGAVLLKGDGGFRGVDHLQLRTDGVEHDLDPNPTVSTSFVSDK